MLRVAAIVADTSAEGPGRRWALWVQGCSIRCPGCCNPEMFDPRRGRAVELDEQSESSGGGNPAGSAGRAGGGAPRGIDELGAGIAEARARGVEGVTFLGGEPFEQAAGLAELARRAKLLGMTVMVFSGYTLDQLRGRADAAELLGLTDLLVDGPYDRTRPEPPPPLGRRWIGSANQVMHHLTAAYAAGDPRMREGNTIEIRLRSGALTINGWPSADRLVKPHG